MQRTLARQAIFSAKTFAAAILALYIALRLDLERPYWAMLTVYIVAQPLSGMVRSKSLYRVIGTITGAAMSVVLLPALVDTPVLLTLAVAGWISLCLYASLLDGTPRSYAFILAGYTTALIAFPSVDAPGDIFLTALARVEEITLGIVCMTVVSELVFPERVGPMLHVRTDAWFADLGAWARSLLGERRPGQNSVQLISRLAELETLRFHAIYEDPALQATTDAFGALQRRMQMLLTALSGIQDRLRDLPQDRPEARGILARVAAQFEPAAPPSAALLALIDARVAAEPAADWRGTTRRSLLGLLRELVELWSDCRQLRAALAGNAVAVPDRHVKVEHHRDYRLAALSALAAFVAIALTTAVWIWTAWPQGYVAAEMAAVLCCLFARLDDPAPSISSFLLWSNVASVIAAVYLFAILPPIDDFVPLALVLAPTYLLLGLGMASQRFLGMSLALAINSLAPLALGPVFTADFASFVNASLAQAIGIWMALGVTRLLRSLGARAAGQRLRRIGRAELASIACGRLRPDRTWLEGRAIDRLGATGTRLDTASELAALAELRAGLNALWLRELAPSLPNPTAQAIRAVLARLAREFRTGSDAPPSSVLRARIDLAFRRAPAETPQVRVALAGLRRALFPGAAAPSPAPAPDGADLQRAA